MNCPKCNGGVLEVEALKAYAKQMERGWIQRDLLIERLDEAMASPEKIAEDTNQVGGYVSGLDLTETDEDIINRAIVIIKLAGMRQMLESFTEKIDRATEKLQKILMEKEECSND